MYDIVFLLCEQTLQCTEVFINQTKLIPYSSNCNIVSIFYLKTAIMSTTDITLLNLTNCH